MRFNIHLYPSTFRFESRILRETRALIELDLVDKIEIIARWESGLAEVEDIDDRRQVLRVRLYLNRFVSADEGVSKLLLFLEWWGRILWRYGWKKVEFVNCHSLSVLPLGYILKCFRSKKLIYDTHELETETWMTKGLRQRLARNIESFCMRRVDELVVVSPSIGKWYEERYGKKKAHVVRNVPDLVDQRGLKKVDLKGKLEIPPDDLLFLYYGILEPGRGIELMVEVFNSCPANRHVVFVGFGSLEELVKNKARLSGQIHFHPPVSPREVLSYAASADVGMALIENISLSYYYCLPNKLFEYLACGLPVVVSDFPDMGSIVDEFDCGWKIEPRKGDVAKLVSQLDIRQIAGKKAKAENAGRELVWEKEKVKLASIFGGSRV